MRWVSRLRLRLRSLFRAGEVERELDEELQYHLARLMDDYVAAGMTRRDARYRALREMGAIDQRKEDCRDARGLALVDSLRQDLTYALRALRKSPGFSCVAILSLAIGVGANTTIFTFVNAVLLRPLPYPGSDRLVVLHEHALDSSEPLNVHPLSFVEWRIRTRSFEKLVLVQAPPLNVIGSTGPEMINRMLTTSELFQVFGVHPVLGRGFTEEDTRPGNHEQVILGHGFWRRWFGGDPGVIGRQLRAQDGSLTIVGVAPAGFRIGLIEPEALTPLTIDPANPSATGSRSFQCYGRLAPGVGLDAARAEMTAIASALRGRHRVNDGMGVLVSGLHEYLVREARPGLRLLMGVVATVLAIACVNLAALLMARGIGRRSELAVRAALGASRGRLLRQLVIESLVLSSLGGAAGLVIASWAVQALLALSLTGGALTSGASGPARLDAACLLFTFALSTATTLVFGLMPARQASRVDPQTALREWTRAATATRGQHRLRRVLVVAEVALAVVLLVGAGLLLRTLASLGRVSLGFQPAETITMGLFLGLRPPETRIAVIDQILDRVETVPGVKSAGTIQFLPLQGATCGTSFWLEEHAGGRDPDRALPTECSLVSRGYFAAMGIPVLDGRPFDRRDRPSSPRVLLVNQSFAKRYFPDGRVLGRRIFVRSSNQALAEIVGVAGDVRHNGLTSEPAPTVFLLHAQTPGYITNLVVRTRGDPISHAAAIRRAIHEADPTQAVSSARTIEGDVARVLARPRLQAILVTGFAIIAVILAAIGVYGLIAYVVTQRAHEIGIRLALGATRRTVFFELFDQGARLVAAGLVLGLAAAAATRHFVSTLVFGVTTGDPQTYLLAALMFSAAALAAVVIPARRASRVEPVTALRCQ
jgi:putative ABC transport system permease protein